MAQKRNYEWPQATAWDGFFTQDKVGGITERVDPASVMARLRDEGFLDDVDEVVQQALLAVASAGYIKELNLGEISDVDVASAQADQFLKFNGTLWVPASVPGGASDHKVLASDSATVAGYLYDVLKAANGSAISLTKTGNTLVIDVAQSTDADPVLLTASLLTENGVAQFTGTCWSSVQSEGDWGGNSQGTTDKYFKLLPLARGTVSKATVYVGYVNGQDPFMGSGSWGAIRVGLFTEAGVLKGSTDWYRGINATGKLTLDMTAENGQTLTIERNTLYWLGIIARGVDLVSYVKSATALNLTTLRHSVTIRNDQAGAAWSTMTDTAAGSVSNQIPICMLSAS